MEGEHSLARLFSEFWPASGFLIDGIPALRQFARGGGVVGPLAGLEVSPTSLLSGNSR